MTEAEKYQGYSWIKVKRSKPIDVDGVPHVSEAHHVEETTFLIDEVRKLAARVDELTLELAKYRLREHDQMQMAARQAYELRADHLPYEEDTRPRG